MMNTSQRLSFVLLAVAASASATDSVAPKHVVELYTSQGCYSCPPADAFLAELITRGDVVGLEFHVDYWDDLVYGAAGQWRDPFSSPAYSDRQRAYERRGLGGRNGVYTPQIVVDGRRAEVGSDRRAVHSALEGVDGERLQVSVTASGADGLRVSVSGRAGDDTDTPAALWLVRFDRRHVTPVSAGENQGKTLSNVHVVTAMAQIGEWSGTPVTVDLPRGRPTSAQGCAVLVQSASTGPVLGAAYCPGL